MSDRRQIDNHLLGYRIECVRHFDEQGALSSQWYEVLTPESGLLGHFAQRSEAERAVIARELGATTSVAAA